MVFTVVHPFQGDIAVSIEVGSKDSIFEVTDKILSSAAPERSSRIEIDDEDPLAFTLFPIYRQLEKIRTFPDTALRPESLAESTAERPVFHIRRSIEEDLMVESMREGESPQTGIRIVEEIGITGLRVEGYHRIARIYIEVHTVVGGMREALHLTCSGGSIHSHHSILTKTGSSLTVYRAAAAEDSTESIGRYRRLMMSPMQKVR